MLFSFLGKGDGIAEGVKLQVSPDPVKLDQYLSVNMTGRILKDVPATAVLKVQHHKLKSVWGMDFEIPIPCLMGKYGSW